MVKISEHLLINIKADLEELLAQNSWRRNTTRNNDRYLNILEDEISEIEKILSGGKNEVPEK